MSLGKIVAAKEVSALLKKGIINRDGVRIIDCAFAVAPKPDWKKFEKESYGKFESLLSEPSNSKLLYANGHIPQSIHVDLDIAMYPSKFQRFTHYPAELFEKYAQLLGLNSGEHFIFYGHGAFGGMLFASKIAWLFKTYGHTNISLIDGGFQSWKNNEGEVSIDNLLVPKGNWKAGDGFKSHVITYEELEAKDAHDKQYVTKTSEVNFLDTRSRGQFNGTEDTGLDPHRVNGTRIAGFKNVPSVELLNRDGLLNNENDIRTWLNQNGYTAGQDVVTSCNSGVQAALLAYVMDAVLPDSKPRLYNGSLKEMELKDPKKINEGPQHLPH